MGFYGSNYPTNSVKALKEVHRVSKKRPTFWLAITLTHMNGFWCFLAEMLRIK